MLELEVYCCWVVNISPGLVASVAWLLVLGACDSDDSKNAGDGGASDVGAGSTFEKNLTGTFSFGGVTLPCKVSSQLFPASKEYSIVCDNSDDSNNYRFVQVTWIRTARSQRAKLQPDRQTSRSLVAATS